MLLLLGRVYFEVYFEDFSFQRPSSDPGEMHVKIHLTVYKITNPTIV